MKVYVVTAGDTTPFEVVCRTRESAEARLAEPEYAAHPFRKWWIEERTVDDPTVDAVDAHAFAMFSAGWRAAMAQAFYHPDELEGDIGPEVPGPEGMAIVEPPTAAAFYRAVPDAAARHCTQSLVEAVIAFAESGRFLHDDAPAARMAREFAVAARRHFGLPSPTV